jgi:probable HAF family extracellular repeat protein
MPRNHRLTRHASRQRRQRNAFLALESLDVRTLPSASITDLVPLAGGNVTGINAGVVVGTKVVSADQHDAFLINPSGAMNDLGSLSGFGSSDGTGLNSSGEVVGYADSSGGLGGDATTEGFLDINGKLTALGTFGGTSSEANGINDSGQVVGWADTKSGQDAFLYSAGQLQDLGGLPGAMASVATAINNVGGIGYSSVGNGSGGGAITKNAFLYSQGKFTDLGTPNGFSIAYAINNSGQIVGEWNGSGNNAHAFLWNNGVMTDLGKLPGEAVSIAESINDSGQVVGYATNAGTGGAVPVEPDHAFLDENGVMTDLNSLLPANSGWVLNTATSIDNSGEIVGMGTLNGAVHAYLVSVPGPAPTPTPTPTPSPSPTPTPTPTPFPTPTPTPIPKPTGLTTPKPAPPPKPAPKLTVQPNLLASGPFRTRISLAIKPKRAKFGRPIMLTASVKNLSRPRVEPIGTATFLEGETVEGTVAILAGKAKLRTSSLRAGKDPIRVVYDGTTRFAQSASGTLMESVGTHHSKTPRLVTSDAGGVVHFHRNALLRRYGVNWHAIRA